MNSERSLLDLSDKRFWRVATFPVLLFTSIYLILVPEWHQAFACRRPAETHVVNTYYGITENPWTCRAKKTTTYRGTGATSETLSTTTNVYEKGVVTDFDLLESELAVVNAALVWPGYSNKYVEKKYTTTVSQDNRSSSTSYLDGLGNAIAAMDGNNNWTISLADAEGRTVLTKSDDGRTTNTYDAAGLVTLASNTDTSGRTTTTAYSYDKQGRQISVAHDGKLAQTTEYTTDTLGQRLKTVSDIVTLDDGITTGVNTTITVTDGAGRVVREIFEGVNGGRRESITDYDEHGRKSYTRSFRGLETFTKYDSAGREIETKQKAEGRETTTRRSYDRFGRLMWEQSPLQAEANPQQFKTYLYNTLGSSSATTYGLLTRVNFGNSGTFDPKVIHFRRDVHRRG